MNTKQAQQVSAVDGARRPRRDIAKQMVERGQRLRSRAGVLIGLSLGLVALLTVLE
ncbi:hypothetical protein [Massilia suwonensis]|uniref:Uncharacterized protein n=1 Tax=Massilia suwonensis TaxID=648895 RepID=A0ABW0MSC5_9BURK